MSDCNSPHQTVQILLIVAVEFKVSRNLFGENGKTAAGWQPCILTIQVSSGSSRRRSMGAMMVVAWEQGERRRREWCEEEGFNRTFRCFSADKSQRLLNSKLLFVWSVRHVDSLQ